MAKKRKDVKLDLYLSLEVIKFIDKVSKLSGRNKNDVFNVLVAAALVREKLKEQSNDKGRY